MVDTTILKKWGIVYPSLPITEGTYSVALPVAKLHLLDCIKLLKLDADNGYYLLDVALHVSTHNDSAIFLVGTGTYLAIEVADLSTVLPHMHLAHSKDFTIQILEFDSNNFT
jgi:hypothetical protein